MSVFYFHRGIQKYFKTSAIAELSICWPIPSAKTQISSDFSVEGYQLGHIPNVKSVHFSQIGSDCFLKDCQFGCIRNVKSV